MTTCVKEHLRESFSYERPLREERLLEQIRSVKLFGYVQRDIDVPEELRKNFAIFPPNFKNRDVSRHDIALRIKHYAEKEGLICQPMRSCFLENGTINYSSTPVLYRFGTSLQTILSLRGICSS